MSAVSASLLIAVLSSTLLAGTGATDRPRAAQIHPDVVGALTTRQHPASFPDLPPEDVWSACGPLAIAGLARAYGLPADDRQLIAVAPRYGWTRAGGMNGPQNFQRMLAGELGLRCDFVSRPEAEDALRAGQPVVVSTTKHYFLAQAIRADGRWYVGNSGLALVGGQLWLSPEEMLALAGPRLEYLAVTGNATAEVPAAATSGPAYWAEQARQAAMRYGIDPTYFERQMRLESMGYREDVIYCRLRSPAGAEGIAQIMRVYHPGVDPCDPHAALDYAARLMQAHLARYNGSWRLALAAYNAGAGAVARYGGVPPFAETQRYLQQILG